MKKRCIAAMSVLVSLVLLTGASITAEASDPVKVGIPFLTYWNGTLSYGRINPDTDELEGYFADLFHEIDKADDSITIEIVPVELDDPFTLAEKAKEAGCDLLAGNMVGSVDMGEYEMFASGQPLMFNRLAYVTNNPDTPEIMSIADLAGKKVLVHDMYFDFLSSFTDENAFEVVSVPPEEQLQILDSVSTGEYDAIIPAVSMNLYSHDISAFGVASISKLDRSWSSTIPWAYLRDRKEVADQVSGVLKQLMKDGALTEISRSYFGIDVSQPTDDPELLDALWEKQEQGY